MIAAWRVAVPAIAAAFCAGYRRAPLVRAFGFAGTFHITVAAFVAGFVLLLIR